MVAEQLLLSPPLLTAPEEHLHCIAFPFGKARRRLRTLSPFLKSFGNFLLIALQAHRPRKEIRKLPTYLCMYYYALCSGDIVTWKEKASSRFGSAVF